VKPLMIRIGNFLFRYRNRLFPVLILAIFSFAPPPTEIFRQEFLEGFKDIIALALAISGLAVRAVVIGYAYIKRGGLKKQVYADHLVTEGMFSLCRNPLYFGNVLIYIGVFLMHGNPVVLLTGTALYLFIYQCIIYAEEAYLGTKFGSSYADYCNTVPRWIPRVRHFHRATEGMAFNMKLVIIKDYATIATTVIALVLTEAYEYIALPNIYTHIRYLLFLSAVVIACGLWTAIVRIIKKRPVHIA